MGAFWGLKQHLAMLYIYERYAIEAGERFMGLKKEKITFLYNILYNIFAYIIYIL